MKSCVDNPALFYEKLGQEMIVMCATYVDDTLHVGTKEES